MRTPQRMMLLILAIGLAAAGCGKDGDNNDNGGLTGPVTAPSGWVGRYAGTLESGACTGRLFGGAVPDTFSVCASDSVSYFPGTACEVSWDETTLHFSCSGSATAEGCTVASTFSATATRSGDDLTFIYRYEVSYSGTCGDATDECEQVTGTYARISTTPDDGECGDIGFPFTFRVPGNPGVDEWLVTARDDMRAQYQRDFVAALSAW